MAKLRFWTPQEVETLIAVVNSEKLRIKGIEKYARQSGRTVKAVSFKFYHHKDSKPLKGKLGRPVGSKTKNRSVDPLNTSTQRGVELPGGFVFNFTPKKAEMFENHVRLYF